MKNAQENESKGQKFKRLATQRLGKILKYMNLLGNLSSSQYEKTEAQISNIFDKIAQKLNETHAKFSKKVTSEDLEF
ncbi:MAG TPA: hypothetical protein VGB37_17485 [Candidatus Lokiarchaeia archaeon]